MNYTSLKYEKLAGVARLTINRPDAMNAITPVLLAELKDAFEDAGKDPQVKVAVLTGEGRAFSAGVDLKALGERKLEKGKVGPILDIPARELIETIQNLPKVVIAMVNGFCFTGALEIMLSCDLVVASEDAKLGDTHARWGLRPTWGMSQRLPRTVGLIKARELSFTAKMIDGREAERIGLVNMAVPKEKLEEATNELITQVTANSVESLAAYKYLYNKGMRQTLQQGLELEFNTEFDIKETEDRIAKFSKK